MNRLTERTSDGIAYTKIPLNESHLNKLNKRGVIEQCFTGFVADHLAAYEDSGLSPEEVQELAKAKTEKESAEYVVEAIGSEAKHIIDLLRAKEEGRLVVLEGGKNIENSRHV